MACILSIKVIPSSGRQACILESTGTIKCYLKSPAEDGKANRELIKLFANMLKIEQRAVIILTGLTSPKKKLKINAPLSEQACYALLGLDYQKPLIG